MSLPPANRRGVIASPLTANGVATSVRLCRVPGPITVMYTILRPGFPVGACKTDSGGGGSCTTSDTQRDLYGGHVGCY